MGIKRSIQNWLFSNFFEDGKLSLKEANVSRLEAELYFKELALLKVKSIISGILSQCVLRNYEDNKEVKTESYLRWNIRPNKNDKQHDFINSIVSHLIDYNECLVINYQGEYLIADNFCRETFAVKKNEYTGVVVKDFSFNRKFYEDEVYYFSLNDESIRHYIDGVYTSYANMLGAAKENYLNIADKHYFLNISTAASNEPDFEAQFAEMTGEKLKEFYGHGKKVLPVYEGYKYEDANKGNNQSSTEFRELRKEVFSLCAESFKIPISLMFGDTANIDDAILNNLMTLCMKPIFKMMQEEISYKDYGLKAVTKYYEYDFSQVKYFNVIEMATAIDKLLGSGVFCIDEIRIKLNEMPLNTEWSKRHYMTKNYSTIQELLKDMDIEDIHEIDGTLEKGGKEIEMEIETTSQ